MPEPLTTINPRYSGPNALATGWEETRRVLETTMVNWLGESRSWRS